MIRIAPICLRSTMTHDPRVIMVGVQRKSIFKRHYHSTEFHCASLTQKNNREDRFLATLLKPIPLLLKMNYSSSLFPHSHPKLYFSNKKVPRSQKRKPEKTTFPNQFIFVRRYMLSMTSALGSRILIRDMINDHPTLTRNPYNKLYKPLSMGV